jgi:hypothetical protein
MHEHQQDHLTPDDLDALLSESSAAPVSLHLESCRDCRELLEAERTLVGLLDEMPRFDPAPGFGDRVMARVNVPDPFALRALRTLRGKVAVSRRSLVFATSLVVVLVATMGGSVAWSLANQEFFAAVGTSVAGEAARWFWLGLQALASNLVEQPWYEDALNVVGTPARLALFSGMASLLYLSGVLALRRLMALPTQRVAHAQF